jgi:Peptidase family S41
MMSWIILLYLLGAHVAVGASQSVSSVGFAAAAPPPPAATSPAAPSSETDSPCAAVGALVQKSTALVPVVPAQIAWDCIHSVPLNITAAVPWLESLKPYVAWQSTLAYIKNPPKWFPVPPIDVYAELDKMIANIHSYVNEYDFEFALYRLFQKTGDGHFRYLPTLVNGIVSFGRPVALVSVSNDGQSLPQPYVYSDILLATTESAFHPSPITTINGHDAVGYLFWLSQYSPLQDPEAQYNDVMYSLPQIALAGGAGMFAGGGRGGPIYPNATTELTFANGTSASLPNFARVLQDFVGITNGQDIYDQYLTGHPTRSGYLIPGTGIPRTPPAPGYPAPVLRQINNNIGGYYLDGSPYDDVAVLTVGSFLGVDGDETRFQQIAFDFIKQSNLEGKHRLVIDLRGNGGGTLLQAYNLFTNLFPDLIPYGATRFRAHEALDIIGQTVSTVAGPIYPWNISNPPGTGRVLNSFLGVPFDYAADVDINYQNFDSWQEKYGPHAFNDDVFSSIIRWNLSDPTMNYTNGIVVNGYQDRTGIVLGRPFAAENIVLLYDGYCASTCAIFSEFMVQQGGVTTVGVGGRPFYEPMAGVGGTKGTKGTKGTNSWDFETVYSFANSTFRLGTPEQQAAWEGTELGSYSLAPMLRSADHGGFLNIRDGIRQGDETQTPLQYVWDPTDCRIWYEASFTVDVSALWKRVVDVTWGGAKCAFTLDQWKEKRELDDIVRGRRHHRRDMAEEEFEALRAGVHQFTELRDAKATGDAEMLP